MVKDVSSRVVQYCFSSIFVYMKERNVVEFADCIGLIHCLSRETRAPVRESVVGCVHLSGMDEHSSLNLAFISINYQEDIMLNTNQNSLAKLN